MATIADRVGELIDEAVRPRKTLVSPEGVELTVQIARLTERGTAFMVDLLLMHGVMAAIFVAGELFLSKKNAAVVSAIVLFAAFLVRNLYFLHYELSAQGKTPGKRVCGLRVINRNGGELTPSAVIARNLTREAEFFLPLSLMLGFDAAKGVGWQATLIGWMLVMASLPLWNRDRLRMGDLIAGTQVIALPRRYLSYDLSVEAPEGNLARYKFTERQLSVYGAYELQALEELLRRPRTPEAERQLVLACEKIRRKIGWEGEVSPPAARAFLLEFYADQRAALERGQLFGKLRTDQNDVGPTGPSALNRKR